MEQPKPTYDTSNIKAPLSNIEEYISDERKELETYVDSIFSISLENVEKVYNSIFSYNKNIPYLINTIMFAFDICLKQREALFQLFTKMIKVFPFKKVIKNKALNKSVYLTKKNPSANKNDDKNLAKIFNIFEPNSAELFIKDDNFEEFVKITSQKNERSFNSINVGYYSPFNLIKMDDFDHITTTCTKLYRIDVSYMQLMAFFGSVKIFKFALLNGIFDESALEKYAIAGGNTEIIKILEQRNVLFDYCFEVSIKFHRINTSGWLVDHYKIEQCSLAKPLYYYNDRLTTFMVENKFIEDKNDEEYAIIASGRSGNIYAYKYLIEKGIEENSHSKTEVFLATLRNKDAAFMDYMLTKRHIDPNARCKKDANRNIILYSFFSGEILEDTALTIAIRSNDMELVKLLVEHYHVNVEGHATEVLKMMTEDEPCPTYKTNMTPLHVAVKKNNIEMVKYLVEEAHANVNAKEKKTLETYDNGMKVRSTTSVMCALHYAIENRSLEMVKLLVEKYHADPTVYQIEVENRRIIRKLSPFMLAVDSDCDYLIDYFVNHCNADVKELAIIVDYKVMKYNAIEYALDYDKRIALNYLVNELKLVPTEKQRRRIKNRLK